MNAFSPIYLSWIFSLPYWKNLHDFVVAFFLVMFYQIVGWQKMLFPPARRLKAFVNKTQFCADLLKDDYNGFEQFCYLSGLYVKSKEVRKKYLTF